MNDEIYTADQLARIFSRTPRTIWAWAQKGKIPKGTAISKRSRYWRRSEIEKWLDDRRTA